ncbi:MAG: sulfonate ABC transporter [Crenarchaeota archaeon]|nr:sulfonate ABC transporter [Thermoproteota archaeon]
MARTAVCPVCGEKVEVPDDVLDGEIIEHECGAMLVVRVEGNDVRLEEFKGVEEDWGE